MSTSLSRWHRPLTAWMRLFYLCSFCFLELVVRTHAKDEAKVPIIKWGQNPKNLYLTVQLSDAVLPEIKMEEKRLRIQYTAKGQPYAADLKLLRGINVTESKHEVSRLSLRFTLKKLRNEPCWLRLLRSKKNVLWLHRDPDRAYPDECQMAKELWREEYFNAKLEGRDPSRGRAPEGPEVPFPSGSPDKKAEEENFVAAVEAFRKRAVPRKSLPKASKRRAASGKKKL
eukprot:TRINITY_DN2757_c0_g2_i1.p1 TRINITY_DN2757_c0_g2~~TRINITY_DN2757_c0_g2_i1.p1  ORF type:complete len:228 (+),score=39.17 TRINITY_DN2757_c0_g2_i1:293-976(+)